jgi:U3 small nucleolar RNA-associated protein 24
MGKARKTRKFAQVKRMISLKDSRKAGEVKKKTPAEDEVVHYKTQPSHLFFLANPALGPPYHLLLDTNFINFSIQNKLDVFKSSMDCLLGKVIPCISECVIAELEKLGKKYRLALRIAKDPRFKRLKCTHSGTYADDCIVERVTQNRIFTVGTCDKDLKRRLRKIPGVPIMYISSHRYTIERMPDALGAPRT